jgi:3-phenylpropionate/trans-cinnamate dioxygenase ferredoxin reductase component
MRFDYLIVGGGMAADAAARGIRERDTDGAIGILSADVDPPYARPALSKKLWTDPDFTFEQVPLGTVADTGAELRLGVVVTSIDREVHEVVLDSGERVGYGRLLLVTGSTPATLDGDPDERVIAFRSEQDYLAVREQAPGKRVVVIGGGYIGGELAAALVQHDATVTLVTPDATLGDSTFPPELAGEYQGLFTEHGVDVRTGRRAERTSSTPDAVTVTLDDGATLEADLVIVGLGAAPVVELAAASGLEVTDGVVVDAQLRTADPDVWAAGDIANYPDPILGRTRVEHVDQATASGQAAGRNMAGADEAYTHTPFFYSAVFGTRWEAVGSVSTELETLVDRLDDERAVVYYLAEGRAVGVLLWRVADATDAARDVLRDPPEDPQSLRGRIG